MFSALALTVNAQSAGDWLMYQADPSHSGVGSGNPVITPSLLWKTNLHSSDADSVSSFNSPILVDGVIYVGLGGVYAEISEYVPPLTWGGIFALESLKRRHTLGLQR